MGTVRRFIRSNMVFKKLRNHGKILLFVGREKKGQAVFSEATEKATLLQLSI